MATGWPMKVTYANGDVYSASDVNDTNGTINLLGQSVAVTAGKNKILNSAAQIWQRGTSITTSGAYTADRWVEVNGANNIVVSRSTDVPSSLGFQYSMSRAGIGSNINQRIEAANAAQLAGQTVTLSFYYKSTAGADNFSTLFYYANAADNFAALTQIGSTQTIATPATSWTRVSYTFTSISANAANGLAIYFARGSGATSTTLMTGFQLEVGSTATAFQTATGTIQGELAACQRYCFAVTSGATDRTISQGTYYNSTTLVSTLAYPVTMRTTPSATIVTAANYWVIYGNNTQDYADAASFGGAGLNAGNVEITGNASGTQGTGGQLRTNNAAASIILSAEL